MCRFLPTLYGAVFVVLRFFCESLSLSFAKLILFYIIYAAMYRPYSADLTTVKKCFWTMVYACIFDAYAMHHPIWNRNYYVYIAQKAHFAEITCRIKSLILFLPYASTSYF